VQIVFSYTEGGKRPFIVSPFDQFMNE
jgi:hypothetical protein